MQIEIRQLANERPDTVSPDVWGAFINEREAAALAEGKRVADAQEAMNRGYSSAGNQPSGGKPHTTEQPTLSDILILQQRSAATSHASGVNPYGFSGSPMSGFPFPRR